MNKNDKAILGLVVVLLIQTGLVFYTDFRYNSLQAEIIKRGFAEFVVCKDNNHRTEFKWKEAK